MKNKIVLKGVKMENILSKYSIGKDINNPKIWDRFIFLDDGKWGNMRLHVAIVTNIYDFDDTKNIKVKVCKDDSTQVEEVPLSERIKENINYNDDLYVTNPQKVLECSIPSYDENLIYFINTKDGMYKWFSVDVQSWWQAGGLLTYDVYDKERSKEINLPIQDIEDKLLEEFNKIN